jgi:peptidoglycan/LPS O-acetylase OafA/YrhL
MTVARIELPPPRNGLPSASIQPSIQPSTRLPALDGLRGVASLVVVLHHLYLIAIPTLISQGGTTVGSAYWWISETPFKLATAGTEAVTVFFILSGLVVALPALRHPAFSWRSFYASRAVRLYLPVWAALLVAACAVWFIPRSTGAVSGGSWLAMTNAQSVPFSYLLSQATLTRAAYGVDNALWSLRWELVFSALLPLYVVIARRLRRGAVPSLAICVAATMIGALAHIPALQYLPEFFAGTIVAARLTDLQDYARRSSNGPNARILKAVFVTGSATLLVAGWLARGLIAPTSLIGVVLEQLSVLGGLGLVVAAIIIGGLQRLLQHPAAQWLGKISFSLYLVHVPLLATLAYTLGDGTWWLVGALGVPGSLLAAWAFHAGVERPSHRLARWIGRLVVSAPRAGFVPVSRLSAYPSAEYPVELARLSR